MKLHRNRDKLVIAIVCGLMLACVSGMSQGTIQFQNIGPEFDAPVRMPDGSLVPVGQNFYAELLAGTSPASVAPFATPVVRPFVIPGYFGIGTPEFTLAGFAPGSRPWFQVRVWGWAELPPTCYGDCPPPTYYGASPIFQLGAPEGLGDPVPYRRYRGRLYLECRGFNSCPNP